MAFTKIFPLKEARVLEFRAQGHNIFNLVNYSSIDTSVTSPTFGRVTAAGACDSSRLRHAFVFEVDATAGNALEEDGYDSHSKPIR